jgi:NAD-dependent SIR2 family protein deacetylase
MSLMPGPPGAISLHDFVQRHPRLFVLTGAGISTASGIPGYRDASGRWLGGTPTQLREFLQLEAARQRYWARSMVGWLTVAAARPNGAHEALARLGALGRITQLVTQNVDGLHQRAGSTEVIELHGNIGRVVCLDCGEEHSRESVQHLLEAANPSLSRAVASPAPDGDAHVETASLENFRVPACTCCAGTLKPDVVFFGESVPRARVEDAAAALERADAVLVVGSSLTVYSGYRFCIWAQRLGKPIAALNLGLTRADPLLEMKIEQACAPALVQLVRQLERGAP